MQFEPSRQYLPDEHLSIEIPAIRGSRAVADHVERVLIAESGIVSVRCNAKTGRLHVVYENDRITCQRLLQIVDASMPRRDVMQR